MPDSRSDIVRAKLARIRGIGRQPRRNLLGELRQRLVGAGTSSQRASAGSSGGRDKGVHECSFVGDDLGIVRHHVTISPAYRAVDKT